MTKISIKYTFLSPGGGVEEGTKFIYIHVNIICDVTEKR
jgi:hypothetical protein